MNRNKDKEKCKSKKYIKIKMRTRFLFFSIIITFSFIAFVIIRLLEQLGFSINRIKNPSVIIFMLCVLCIILSAVASNFMIMKVFNPLNQINKALKKIANGDYSVKLEYDGQIEEFAEFFKNFNNMAKELNSVEMIRNDFIADVSHEFKTPLSSVTGYVTLLQDPELTEEERKEYIQKVFFNIDKLNDLTNNILRISKIENQTYLDPPVSFRLDEQIREAIVILEAKWSRKNIELDIDLPGYQKENIQAELKDGYLTIRAKYSDHQEETAQKTGRFIRRERCTGSCSRSFYVGEEITREDIKAKYENGVLRLSVPKKEPKKPEAEAKKFITIEG